MVGIRNLRGPLAVLPIVAAAVFGYSPAMAVPGQIQPGVTYSGNGTYYGSTNAGSCGYGVLLPAWAHSLTQVAINNAQYSDSLACGAVLTVQGTGAGHGATPISTTPFQAIVTDMCSCPANGLDLGKAGDGMWGIKWSLTSPASASSPLQYKFEASNLYYLKFQVVGARNPVSTVTVQGLYQNTARTQDNFFVVQPQSSAARFPLTVKVTDIYGETLTDQIPNLTNDVLLTGTNKVQFSQH